MNLIYGELIFYQLTCLGCFFQFVLFLKPAQMNGFTEVSFFNAEHERQMFLLAKPKKVPTTLLFTKESDSLLFILLHDLVYTMY